jgi:hypothetical protein
MKDVRLNIFLGKKGWRWRFIIDGDIQCIGTNHFPSQEDALLHAKRTLMMPWFTEEPPEQDVINFEV